MKNTEYSREEYHLLKAKGEVITELRKDAGYKNGKDFAKHIHMSPSLYMRYETGENMKTISLHRLLSHHDMNLQQYYTLVYKIVDEKNKVSQN